MYRYTNKNKNARINEKLVTNSTFDVATEGREEGSLTATANVRERVDVNSGRSLTGLSVRTAGGRNIRFTGHEARTLLRVLLKAAEGR